jgi:cytochrome c oxidase assembly protein subunit 15
MIASTPHPDQAVYNPVSTRTGRQIGYWLLAVALTVALMVMVGGLTRLTGSGLSITEWRPVTGTLPPLSEEAWQSEFAKYQTIPQFHIVNHDMTLPEFKGIYYWEWGHRLLGRLIGLIFAIPALIFALQGKLTRHDLPRMVLLFALGGAQGALGWWMVASGLSERINVSQYRLAAHLGLALIIFAALFWSALDRLQPSQPRTSGSSVQQSGLFVMTLLVTFACYAQMLFGAIVAGLRAGLLHNTWPLMDGEFVPSRLFEDDITWVAPFEDPTFAQFDHRLIAYGVALAVIVVWYRVRTALPSLKGRTDLMLAALGIQVLLGILVILWQVPITLAAFHQIGALCLFSAMLWVLHGLKLQPARG